MSDVKLLSTSEERTKVVWQQWFKRDKTNEEDRARIAGTSYARFSLSAATTSAASAFRRDDAV